MNDKDRTTPNLQTNLQSAAIRRGLWFVGLLVAAGIGIAGFSIATGLLVA